MIADDKTAHERIFVVTVGGPLDLVQSQSQRQTHLFRI